MLCVSLEGLAKVVSMCNNVIFHELFLNPESKTALWPPSITSKASSKDILGKACVL
jgi:hypothetical protein